MVVRTTKRIRPAFRPTRVPSTVAATVARGLASFDLAERARRNARAASIELASAAAERRSVDAFLADHASARARSQPQPS